MTQLRVSGSWLVGATGESVGRSRVDLDEDALTGAHLGCMDHGTDVSVGHQRKASGTTGVVARLPGLGHVGNAVLELNEDIIAMVDADAVAGTEVLVDPHSHDSE